ncbi:hypothetical protein [Tuwongella immobilis]|uniref:Uncharacterized protein n=1 Tax=Tuwongella immobilis TaxID=692036 RepID=A0A6C2YIC8_9BACT|nr:hypothetical protein [Tuwongella immobilis]VIP01166.1 unnamed protein product [Tuwongella immobilis]VTR97758.1 unnamed protein product [Tuwongella immobilis]
MAQSESRNSRGALLTADDLTVGGLVTVHHWKRTARASMAMAQRADSGMGTAYRIQAIDLPYLVVQPVGQTSTSVLDIRLVSLMRISESFAQAQIASQGVKPPQDPIDGADIPF